MTYCSYHTCKIFFWSLIPQNKVWAFVLEIDCCPRSLCLEWGRDIYVMHHGFSYFTDYSILSFNNPILLEVVGNCYLPLDPWILIEIIELVWIKFTVIIRRQCMNVHSSLFLNESLKLLKLCKIFTLSLHEINPSLIWIIINEDHIIKEAT